MYSGAARFGLGDSLDDVAGDSSGIYAQDPKLAQLHQLSLLLVQLRSEFNAQLNASANADASFDPAVLTGLAQLIEYYAAQFKTLRASIDATTVNQNALTVADRALLDVGTWAQQTIAALPNAIGAVPNALIDGLSNIVTHTGKDLVTSLALPALAIGALLLGAIAIAKRGEQTRTGRALARHI